MNTERNNGLNKLRGMGRVAVIGCMMLLVAGLATGAENLSAWQKRLPIAFSGYTPPGGGETLTNFPVLVILSNTPTGAEFNYTDFLSPPYDDLRFAAADKTTPLDFEVESWDTNGLSHVWVRVPELITNATIYALWKKSGVVAPPCTTNGVVWTEGFVGVWHMSQTNAQDSTTNRAHAVIAAAVTNAAGQIDGADGFNGSSSYLNVTNYAALAPTKVTYSAWLKVTGGGSHDNNMVLSKGRAGSPPYHSYTIRHRPSDGMLGVSVGLGSESTLYDTTAVALNTFVHVAGTYTSGSFKFYRDGILRASSTSSGAISYAMDDHNLHLGDWGYANFTRRFRGVIDEVRVSSVVRSSNWIWASFFNMASNDTFAAYGTPEFQEFPGFNESGGATNVTSTSAWLNGTLSSTGTSDTAVFAYWGPTDGRTNASAWANTNTWAAPQAPGVFTVQATGLLANSTYYYRFAVSNAAGWAWASEASVFITGEVWLEKTADASEIGPTPGTFTVHRAAAATNEALTVTYTVDGTATPGVDYVALSGTVTIPKGEETATIEVMPFYDHLVEGVETVLVSLTPGLYVIGPASSATVNVEDYGRLVTRTWSGGGANDLASTAANWVEGEAPIMGDAITLRDDGTNKNMTWDLSVPVQSWTQDGYVGTVTVATIYGPGGFTNLVILGDCVISNGVWTHAANPSGNTEVYRLRTAIGGDLIIGVDALVDVTGKGYAAGKGPGYGGGGGSYGGTAYPYNTFKWPVLPCYGSITTPTNLGSGGVLASGGGAILVTVAGAILNDGLIFANGQNNDPVVYVTTGGSGGSIHLLAGELKGTGTIRANGGNGSNWGGAGGGRVALVVTNTGANFSEFTGKKSVYGGNLNASIAGGAGTIYLEQQGDLPGKGELVIDNGGGFVDQRRGVTDLYGVESGFYEFSRITLTNAATLGIRSNETLIVTNTVFNGGGAKRNNGIWLAGGTLQLPSDFAYSNFFIGISATDSTFSPTTSLTIGTNASLYLEQPRVMASDVIIEAGGNLTHSANTSTEAYKLNLTVQGNLTVHAGGSVDVTGKGYTTGGPGSGEGGSYGGRGGAYSSPAGRFSSPTYGSIAAPTNLGSNGSTPGGGAVLLTVSGAINNGGVISADGADAGNFGGSGGSVYLTAGTLTGSGVIRASGGYASHQANGGGGRIALVVTNEGADFANYIGPITAYGGTNTRCVWGGAGTVYLRTSMQDFNGGTLIIDNGGGGATWGALSTEISSNVTDTVVGDVLIRNKGYLVVNTNQNLTLSGVWSNAASFAAYTESKIIFSGASASTSVVYGSTTFMGLVSTNATGKTIQFEAGKTNSVAAYGRLTLKGSDTATNLFLRSIVDSVPWKFKVDPLAEQSIWFVDVKDSDAMTDVGAEVTALNSTNSGGNQNWRFPTVGVGGTNEWTGASNTIWSVRQNWSLDRSPTDDDHIVIPGGKPRYPVLDAARTVNGIAIQSGGSLALGGYNLTATTNAVVAGSLIASDTETITFLADADFTGGTVTPALSTVSLAGGNHQSVNLANRIFHKIVVLNNAGTVSFMNGFAATEFGCEAVSGTRSIAFEKGSTVTLRDLILLGSIASTNIILRSSSTGNRWNLAVSGYRSVRGVDVQDSDASWGVSIPATSSKNSTGNLNWVFDASWSVWLGSSADFHTAANWSPTGVPGADTRVLLEVAKPMTITGAVTVLDLTVGGGFASATGTVNATLTVIDDIVVLDKGVLVLNRPCVVSNGFYVLAGGVLTHSVNGATEANKLNLMIGGDMGVDVNGMVDVKGKGYTTGGPGSGEGGSYGGRGGAYSTPAGRFSAPTYGSIITPKNLGSNGGTQGGGAILLTVFGAINNGGVISADGADAGNFSGSGGSVYLTAGTLTGSGVIRANGGYASNQANGGGGRIALVVTNTGADFSLYTGAILAFGGGAGGGAGTIYKQCAADRQGRGTVLVHNSYSGYTDVPPSSHNVPNEANHTSFMITNTATLRLTNNFVVGDIWLDTANAVLDLGGYTLTVNAREHELGLGNVVNPGAIVWMGLPPGVLIIVK